MIDINTIVIGVFMLLGIFMLLSFYLGYKSASFSKDEEPKKGLIERIDEHRERKHREAVAREKEKTIQEQLQKINDYNGF